MRRAVFFFMFANGSGRRRLLGVPWQLAAAFFAMRGNEGRELISCDRNLDRNGSRLGDYAVRLVASGTGERSGRMFYQCTWARAERSASLAIGGEEVSFNHFAVCGFPAFLVCFEWFYGLAIRWPESWA